MSTDELIRKYLDNNNFLKDSNWNDIAVNQMFMVRIIKNEGRDTSNPLQDIINFQLPAERFEFQHQNLFNQSRNILTGVNRDVYRLSFIENKDYTLRTEYMKMNEFKTGDGKTYNKTMNQYPRDRYFDIECSLIKKNYDKDEWFITKAMILKDCVVETLNDIDFSVDKLEMVKCEINGRCKTVQIIEVGE